MPEFDKEYYARGLADVLAGKTLRECMEGMNGVPQDERTDAKFAGYALGAADGVLTLLRRVVE